MMKKRSTILRRLSIWAGASACAVFVLFCMAAWIWGRMSGETVPILCYGGALLFALFAIAFLLYFFYDRITTVFFRVGGFCLLFVLGSLLYFLVPVNQAGPSEQGGKGAGARRRFHEGEFLRTDGRFVPERALPTRIRVCQPHGLGVLQVARGIGDSHGKHARSSLLRCVSDPCRAVFGWIGFLLFGQGSLERAACRLVETRSDAGHLGVFAQGRIPGQELDRRGYKFCRTIYENVMNSGCVIVDSRKV